MGVAVFPRLRQILQKRGLTVAELGRRIELEYGEPVDPKGLYRLASDEPMLRADLRVAGAAATVLDVDLGELFSVEATPRTATPDHSHLAPEQSRRLSRLLDQQARRPLTRAEARELDDLVLEYGERLYQEKLGEYAAREGLSLQDALKSLQSNLDREVRSYRDDRRNRSRRSENVQRRRRPTVAPTPNAPGASRTSE